MILGGDSVAVAQLGIDRDLITLVGQVLGDNAPFKSTPEHLASVAMEVGAPRFLKRLAAIGRPHAKRSAARHYLPLHAAYAVDVVDVDHSM